AKGYLVTANERQSACIRDTIGETYRSLRGSWRSAAGAKPSRGTLRCRCGWCSAHSRACILALPFLTAISPETFGGRESGTIKPRLSRSNAELLRRSDLVLYN